MDRQDRRVQHGTVEEFLRVLSESKRVQWAEILSHHWHRPGDGTYNKTSRKSNRYTNPVHSPYPVVLRVLRQNVLFGVDYQKMVNVQRNREAEKAWEEMIEGLPSFIKPPPIEQMEVEPFIASAMWNGQGEPDPEFPKYAIRHKRWNQRYIKFWPCSDAKTGRPIPNDSRYYNGETGEEIAFDELEEFWRKPSKSKVQGTEKEISWSVIKFYNIVQIKSMKMIWTFDGPEVNVPEFVQALAR